MAKAVWTAVVNQGTGGKSTYSSLDQIRKDAPYLMGLRKRGSNEYHKYIEIYKGEYTFTKDPIYLIQYGGFMSADPNNLVMLDVRQRQPKMMGWIERYNGRVYYTSRETHKRKTL